MNIAIIGGGFTGLAAAYRLTKLGHKVTLFEKDSVLGGLAHGFKEKGWEWYLEKAYHHLFTNDNDILNLLRELHLDDAIILMRPITGNFWKGSIYQFDNPVNLLRFPGIPFVDRLRTGALIALLKFNPWWQPLEKLTAKQLFLAIGGSKAWNTIWGPIMGSKFGKYGDKVAASWLWARIKKRTPNLIYIRGGFHTLVTALENEIKKQKGSILTNTSVSSIKYPHFAKASWGRHASGNKPKFNISYRLDSGQAYSQSFDSVLLTTPTPVAQKLAPFLPKEYIDPLLEILHLHAHVLILETKQPILEKAYWVNILDKSFPFLGVMAHTNMIDPKYYNNHHLTYFGNYLPDSHPYLSLSVKELLKIYEPFIRKLNPSLNFKLKIENSKLFIGPFAQPVHTLNYSKKAPPLTTPIPNLYLANLDSVYPWDRGTNYAVALGMKAAEKIHLAMIKK